MKKFWVFGKKHSEETEDKENTYLPTRLKGEEIIDVFEVPRWELWLYLLAILFSITVALVSVPIYIRIKEKAGNNLRPEFYQVFVGTVVAIILFSWLIAFLFSGKIVQVLLVTNKRIIYLYNRGWALSGKAYSSRRKESLVKNITQISTKKSFYPHPVLLLISFVSFIVVVFLQVYVKLGLLKSSLTLYVASFLLLLFGLILIVLSITGYKIVNYLFEIDFGQNFDNNRLLGLSVNLISNSWKIKGNNSDAKKLFEKGSILLWRLYS